MVLTQVVLWTGFPLRKSVHQDGWLIDRVTWWEERAKADVFFEWPCILHNPMDHMSKLRKKRQLHIHASTMPGLQCWHRKSYWKLYQLFQLPGTWFCLQMTSEVPVRQVVLGGACPPAKRISHNKFHLLTIRTFWHIVFGTDSNNSNDPLQVKCLMSVWHIFIACPILPLLWTFQIKITHQERVMTQQMQMVQCNFYLLMFVPSYNLLHVITESRWGFHKSTFAHDLLIKVLSTWELFLHVHIFQTCR